MRYLWYTSYQLAVFALFTSQVSVAEKRKMVVATKSNIGEENIPRRRVGLDMATTKRTRLNDCTKGTLSFCGIARIPRNLIQIHPKTG